MDTVNGYTPTEQRILTLLRDGAGHTREELLKCISDPSMNCLRQHLFKLRQKLPRGTEIVCVTRGWKDTYRWVRHLNASE
jgi:hypothetical protein